MPQYLARKGHTYYFRQAVPPELRSIIGMREIKHSLGRNYNAALSACKRVAVEVDGQFTAARAQLAQQEIDPYSPANIRRTQPLALVLPVVNFRRNLVARNGGTNWRRRVVRRRGLDEAGGREAPCGFA